MKFMNKNKKGFTLVELMIVVVIMAILVAVAVPIFNAVTRNAKEKTCGSNARILSGQMNTIAMNEIGGGSGDSAAFTATTLAKDTKINELLGGSNSALVVTYLQGEELPVCPFADADNEYKYKVDATGKVTCSGVGTDGKHS